MKIVSIVKFVSICVVCVVSITSTAREVWTSKYANEWFAKQPYRAGVNYIPSYAINSIEFWQKETFDINTIEKEFALMQSIGFNAARVFLSDLVVNDNPKEFLQRFEQFLQVADKYNIGIMITFFTNGGRNDGKLGKQPEPDGTHNSGWKKTPSLEILGDKSKWHLLENYVKTVIKAHANDTRIICWDIFNEPGNISSAHITKGGKGLSKKDIEYLENCCLDLLKECANWARSLDPIQPITFGIHRYDHDPLGKKFNKIQHAESDIISFHSYESLLSQANLVRNLKRYNKPIMCTEWMGRNRGSSINPILEAHKKNKIWSFMFGFVAGKMQTWRPWKADENEFSEGIWFHDLFYPDHTPYCPEEIAYIKRVLQKK